MASIPLITLEEHFTSKAVHKANQAAGGDQLDMMSEAMLQRLADVGPLRLSSMDESNVAVQVVSLSPSPKADVGTIQASNDELAAHIKAAPPKRLRGFAALPMHDPASAAAELERCVRDLDFVGALVDNHTADGSFYDASAYDVLWDAAQELDVPIYLHPTWPGDALANINYSGGGLNGRSLEITSLGAFAWGWHAETGLHVLRLLASRVFERFPRLKIVIGHSGEMLPYMFPRIAKTTGLWGLKRGFEEVMHVNVWVTTSGMFDLPSLRCLLSHMPLEHILFSVDYPFSSNETGREYVDELKREGVLTAQEIEAFAHGNAQKLLRLELP